MTTLLVLLYALAAVGGAGIVFSRDPRKQIYALSGNGLCLCLLFLGLQAPDVALSEAAVGVAATPLLFAGALAAIRLNRNRATE